MIPESKDLTKAFPTAVAVGASVCSIQFPLMTGGFAGAGASVGTVLWLGLVVFLITWLVAALGFVVGLLLIGLPVWAGLSRLGWASRGAAVASGAFLAALTAGAIFSFSSDSSGLLPAAFLLLPGAAAGLAFHRIAYDKRRSLI